jgi:hypothetical protein
VVLTTLKTRKKGKGLDFDVNAKSSGELCEKIKHVTLRGSDVLPYLNSYVSIETLDPAILAPTQKYCLISELKKIEQLRWDIISEYGWDILQLNGYLSVSYPEVTKNTVSADDKSYVSVLSDYTNTKMIDILPPIIEEHISPRGGVDLLICDGQHRARLAYQMGLPINVVYIRGVNKGYRYYAYPLPNGWHDVELRDNIPSDYVKKFHVVKDHRFLFRDFNSVFSNIGDSRPRDETT